MIEACIYPPSLTDGVPIYSLKGWRQWPHHSYHGRQRSTADLIREAGLVADELAACDLNAKGKHDGE